MEEKKLILPGNFGDEEHHVDADSRRCEFDIKNEQIVFSDRKPTIVFAGDSITHFMEENQFYHKYGFVVDRGIGGDMSKYMRRRFSADVTQLEPKLCIMLIGCNNLWPIEDEKDPETGDYKEESKVAYIKEFEDDMRYMLDEAKKNGFDMWLCSVLPHGSGIPNAEHRNPLIVRVNEMLKNLAAEYNTEYVDYHSNLTKEDGLTLRDGISREGIHPNHAGYELMRQVLEPMLESYFGM
ncbi:MAG: GDSL-type esterase/lipase family protein [Candidatus Avispirillum sp.]